MNNTDDINFWDLPLIQKLFVGFVVTCTIIAALFDLFVSKVIYLLTGFRINLHIAHFVCSILFIILFVILLIGIILSVILNVVFARFL